jgi:MFS family permease
MTGSGPLRGNADFRRYWLGQFASETGSQLSLVAYPLLVLSLGGSPARAGGVATVSLATQLACRLPAGALVDRHDRRAVMLCADLVRACALASIPLAALLGRPTYPHLLAVAFVEGAASAVFRPAATITVRRVVPPAQLTDALARSQARAATATLVGPALGGWLFTQNRLAPFVGDAASYLVSAVQVARIRTPLPAERASTRPDPRVLAGVWWLLRQRSLRNLFGFAGVLNTAIGAAVLATIVTARQHGASGFDIGFVLSAVGAGSVVGALIAPAVVRRVPPGVVCCAIGVALAGALAILSFVTSLWVVGPVLGATLLLSPAAGVLVGRGMLLGAPKELQGRVAVAGDLFMSGPTAVGPLVTGVLLGAVGVRGTWLILVALISAATVAALPTFRTPGFLADPATAPAAPAAALAGASTSPT